MTASSDALSPAAALPVQGIQFLKYVPHAEMLEHLARGWKLSDELHGTNHGHHAVLMVWAGEGEPN
jgi:hypothetical protein